MKKLAILVLALCATSCTSDYMEEIIEEQEVENITALQETAVSEDYQTIYEFVDWVCFYEDLFGLQMPSSPTYDELMHMAAGVVMTDTFADTLAECDCEKVYRLMLEYFSENEPENDVVAYLTHILECGLY